MAVFPFTVRATDSEGSYSDRQFNITVRNSRVERFMIITSGDAYTSPDGSTWTLRSQAGGLTCAYGNGFWLVFNGNGGSNSFTFLKSTDGINYAAIQTANMTFLDETGTAMAANHIGIVGPGMSTLVRMKFFAGKFYLPCINPNTKAFEMWSSADGVTWQRRTIHKTTAAPGYNMIGPFSYVEDNGTLFIPFVVSGTADTASGYSNGYGWSTTDGITWTLYKGVGQTAAITNTKIVGRVNGVYFAFVTNYNGSSTYAGAYHYSTDGINWTTSGFVGANSSSTFGGTTTNTGFWPSNFFYANGVLYLVNSTNKNYRSGAYGEVLMTSTDGLTWTEQQYKTFFPGTTGNYTVGGMFKNGVFLLWGSGAPNGASGFDNTATLTASNGGFRLSVDGVNWTNVNVPTTAAQFFYNDGAAMS